MQTKIRELIEEGETKYIEFKETLSLDVKKQTKEKYIEDAALKTVIAFLNTDGGKLLLGISDNGIIRGLNAEVDKFYENLDDFLLYWKDLVKGRIGAEFYPFIESQLIKLDDKYVLLVECKPSPNPCYLYGKDFYVRTNPATDRLEGPKLVDIISELIEEGETKYIEFKETLSLDVKKQTKEKYIEDAALKTVVAFLNTDGGKLLLGISDNGIIRGLNAEVDKFYEKLDNFLLHWKDLVKGRIGAEFYPFIESQLIKLDDKYVLLVECKPSPNPCYLYGKDFYVRTNPATDRLEGPKLVEYVRNHFK